MAACQTTPYIVGATIGRPQNPNAEGQTKREAKRLPYKQDFIQRRRAGACSRRNERLESKKAAGASPRPTNVTLYAVHTRGGLFFRQQTKPPPIRIPVAVYFPSANLTVPYPHTLGCLFSANISSPPLATYLHSGAGEFVYHKNRRWRSSPTVFFIKICSFVIYAQHFIY